jgi:voltage-gated potassium channel
VSFGLGVGKHTWLLAALVALEVVQPYLAYASIPARVVSSALLFAVVFAVFLADLMSWRQRWIAAAIALPAVLLEITHYALPESSRLLFTSVYHVSIASFLGFVVVLILGRVLRKRQLEIDDVVGAFAGYVMITVLWGNLYALAELLVPGSFRIDPQIAWQLQEWHTRRALFDYFSFATISGVGYNDISTIAPTSNTLKWLEVMCGQFYLAVVVATTVGLKLAQAVRPGSSEGP